LQAITSVSGAPRSEPPTEDPKQQVGGGPKFRGSYAYRSQSPHGYERNATAVHCGSVASNEYQEVANGAVVATPSTSGVAVGQVWARSELTASTEAKTVVARIHRARVRWWRIRARAREGHEHEPGPFEELVVGPQGTTSVCPIRTGFNGENLAIRADLLLLPPRTGRLNHSVTTGGCRGSVA
jgi:hypothetical protein